MLSTAIVVFRETLEMSLIIGIVLAATRGLAGRMLWIAAGIAGGVAGAGLVAFFTETISNMASGLGQELLNAIILFTAAVVIGWTALWMRRHFRSVTSHAKKIGEGVTHGVMPLYSLSLVIGMSVLREGAEIVLFVYGMILSGQGALSIVTGSLSGAVAGVMIGVMLYFGLLKMSTKYMFQVTNALLILLVAGLAAQGAGFLSAAGYFSAYASPMWDSSWLVSDASLAGKALHGLIGYSAHPTQVQGMFYVLTLALLLGIISWTESAGRQTRLRAVVTGAVVMLCLSGMPKQAVAVGYIYSPIVHQGELEIEYSGNRTFDHRRDKDSDQAHEIELAYGVNSRWMTGVEGKIKNAPHESAEMSAIEWKNIIQLAEQGEYWLDSGLLVSYSHAFDPNSADAVEVKLLLEKGWGKFLHRANLSFEQEIGHDASGGPEREFRWSSRYRHDEHFEPGFEIQSNFGKANDSGLFREQEHYIGPAAYGQVVRNVKYEAAYLFGASDATANSAVRFKLEFEKYF